MNRTPIVELLDSDSGSPQEVAASLKDLDRINRWFGGISTTQAMLARVARMTSMNSLSLLEVAAGSGMVPQQMTRQMAKAGVRLNVTLLDRAPSHLTTTFRSVAGDALALPFHDASFDLVSCNLFIHHLSPDELVCFLNEALRVARNAVLINDVVRHPIHLALVYAGTLLYRSRLTRHDAPASVRQAYTPEEMRELIKKTPAAQVQIIRHYLYRMGIIVWKQTAEVHSSHA